MPEERRHSYEDFLEGVSQVAQTSQDDEFLEYLALSQGQPLEPGREIAVGERVRLIRERKGLSLKDLSQRTGLSETTICQIEEELVSPPLGTLIRLAKALEMRMGTIISPGRPKPFTIVRAHQRQAVSRYASKQGAKLGYSYQHLAFDKGDRSMEPFLVTLEPAEVALERSSHDGEEFLFVLEGQMEAHLGEVVEILNPGDCLYYDSSLPHLVRCHGGKEAKVLAVIFPQPIQLTGAEHYNRHHHPWTCSSAPIFGSNNELLGAITLSGPLAGQHQHTLALVISAAEAIERGFRESSLVEEKHQLNLLLKSIFNSISEGVIAVAGDLTITQMNSTAAKLLGLRPTSELGKNLLAAVEPEAALLEAINRQRYFANREITFSLPQGTKTYICSLAPIKDSQSQALGAIITLNEKRKFISLVKKIGGNYAKYEFKDIKGRNGQLLRQIELAKIAARTNSRILITGESGTGKELFAQAIHNFSARRTEPFVAISCAAIPRDLIEAELFGYREGAFTGARREGQVGKFELADRGTLFLDEITGLPLELQAKLLRALQQREILRLGDTKPIPVDVRVIAASNVNLTTKVESAEFREDLYYRLNVVEIVIPPLRERMEDLELLVEHILDRHCQEMGLGKPAVSEEVFQIFRRYSWPGNVRELENAIERAILLSQGGVILPAHLPERIRQALSPSRPQVVSVRQGLQEMIQAALERCGGNVSRAAQELSISRSTIYRKMKEFRIGEERA